MRPVLWLTIILSIVSSTVSLKILGIFPHFGKSHFMMFEEVLKTLAERGHQVHVYSLFPLKTPIKNYKDFSLEDPTIQTTDAFDFSNYRYVNPFTTFFSLVTMGYSSCDYVLGHKHIQDLYKSNEKYDLIILENFNNECLLPFVDKFQAPFIYIFSSVLMPWGYTRFGSPDNPSYLPNHFLAHSIEMSYLERVMNTLITFFNNFAYKYFVFPANQYIAQKHLGPVPNLYNLAFNASLMLINTHPTVTGARPLAPNIIEIGGCHIRPPKKLPGDLQKWLDEAPHGVIYFSLGSLVKSSSFPPEKVQAFVDAFRELKERIVWKWEEPNFPNKPENLLISKWLPQRDILDHPKVKLFIAHCGLMGTLEAVDSGLPILCMPIFGDQPSNQAALQQKGISVKLDYYTDLTKERLLAKIQQALQPEYQERAKEVQRAFHDRPVSALDTAIYWIEYVGRHKGAQHLQLPAKQLSWYQIALLDVLPIYIVILIISFYITKFIFKRICCKSKKKTSTKEERKKKQ